MREALEKGEKDKADDALHEIGHVLEHVDELAEKASLSEAQRDDVKKDVEELLDHFSAIDEKIHGDEQVAHDELSEKIHAAIERLHGHAGP
jgi:chromosome segregation ATPase